MPKKAYQRPLRAPKVTIKVKGKVIEARQLTLPSILTPGGEIPISEALDIVFSMMDPPEQKPEVTK